MIFLYTLIIFALFFLLAGIGYIFQKKVINGSCGGLANVGVDK
ncbi:(Na+)-NQR maturation NqrM, partial [Ruminobacter sp.]